ncbi:MAG: undecaprenyldiphospho-muramoylpentapeptide beta-N-acetylglucosaminyltransferase [Micavibrio aeruginosavorus]|nr:undecaprenyldiphospho-muramoylpentapeptide beta-N-acetylglucosaminyltransferase [Micavibrio aeruginosavorus]
MDNDHNTEKLILLSAGGTGGHMFPAAALAQDLRSRGFRVELVTEPRGKRFTESFGDIPITVIQAGTLGSGLLGKVGGVAGVAMGIIQSMQILGRLKPAVVVGFGGYPSFPAVYAAQRKKIPTIIHEQNAILGRANAALAPRADRIALSMSHIHGLDEADVPRATVTGNPIREEIAALYSKPYPTMQADGILRILIMGGSLGAHVFSDVVPRAFAKLSAAHRARLEVVQQCRPDDLESVRAIYEQAGIKAELHNFINDVPQQLAYCHLVIARSGASTVAEVTTSGRPAIFVPYPHHEDQQQKINADTVADAGGAWVMTQSGFTEEAVLARVETFLQNPETLFRAAENARSMGRPDAARRLGNLVTAIASGWDKNTGKTAEPIITKEG